MSLEILFEIIILSLNWNKIKKNFYADFEVVGKFNLMLLKQVKTLLIKFFFLLIIHPCSGVCLWPFFFVHPFEGVTT